MADQGDTLGELQETERLYTRAKNDYHEIQLCMKAHPKGSPARERCREQTPAIHADLARLKSRVNRLRTQWGAERQQAALAGFDAEGSLAGALRGAARRAGKVEQVFHLACAFIDDPSDRNRNMLAAAVRKAKPAANGRPGVIGRVDVGDITIDGEQLSAWEHGQETLR